MTKVIQVSKLHKKYTSNSVDLQVIKNIDLDIHKGEFVSIMGPSGSGKSTLLYLIGGLEKPTAGSVFINQEALSEMNDYKESEMRRKSIGFVFQFYNLVPHLCVADNILLPAMLGGGKKKDYKERLQHLLKTVDLEDKKYAFPSQLSGGQQQRVAIARALINDPQILLADEPIGNLDSKTGTEIMKLFKHINEVEGKTVVQVTHSKESAQYGNRIIYVRDGEIREKE